MQKFNLKENLLASSFIDKQEHLLSFDIVIKNIVLSNNVDYFDLRKNLFSYIKEYILKAKFKSQTYFLACNYLDFIAIKLSKTKLLNEYSKELIIKELEQLAVGCILISSKYEENDPLIPSLHAFEHVVKNKYFPIDILKKSEVCVLHMLEFNVSFYTIYHFIVILFNFGIIFEDDYFISSIGGISSENKKTDLTNNNQDNNINDENTTNKDSNNIIVAKDNILNNMLDTNKKSDSNKSYCEIEEDSDSYESSSNANISRDHIKQDYLYLKNKSEVFKLVENISNYCKTILDTVINGKYTIVIF